MKLVFTVDILLITNRHIQLCNNLKIQFLRAYTQAETSNPCVSPRPLSIYLIWGGMIQVFLLRPKKIIWQIQFSNWFSKHKHRDQDTSNFKKVSISAELVVSSNIVQFKFHGKVNKCVPCFFSTKPTKEHNKIWSRFACFEKYVFFL